MELSLELRGEVPGEEQRIERYAEQRQGRGNASMLTLYAPHHGADRNGVEAAAQAHSDRTMDRAFLDGASCLHRLSLLHRNMQGGR